MTLQFLTTLLKIFNMRTLLLSTILIAHLASAQCDNGRYSSFIFSDYQVTSNIVYGNNQTYLGVSEDLTMDIYQPVGDIASDRALIMMAHGGSFLTGSKTGPDVVGFCINMAKMGYVVASINYRLGFPIINMQAGATAAVMRGTQDMKAAIRYFRKNVAENGNQYGIDPNQIYAGGVSAGGFIALHLAYLDQESELPSFLDMNATGVQGGLEGQSGNPGYSSDVKAIVNICGAIGDTAWIQPGDEPACHFHGTNDNTVPYGSDMLSVLGIPVTDVDGSYSINEKMNQIGLEHCFEIHENQDHVPSLASAAYADTTLSMMTQFLAAQICNTDYNCEYQSISTGISHHQSMTNYVAAFPNPTENGFNITGILPDDVVLIYNSTGTLVYSFSANQGTWIATENWPNGLYFICSSNQRFSAVKLLKQ